MPRSIPICIECKQRECERFEDEEGGYFDNRCSRCNDRLIEHANERAEWNYYHRN